MSIIEPFIPGLELLANILKYLDNYPKIVYIKAFSLKVYENK